MVCILPDLAGWHSVVGDGVGGVGLPRTIEAPPSSRESGVNMQCMLHACLLVRLEPRGSHVLTRLFRDKIAEAMPKRGGG